MIGSSDFDPQSFAVIGAGPVGCTVAAFLAVGGYEVTLCDVAEELIAPADKTGIIIEGVENFTHKVKHVCNGVDALADYNPDVIIITTKANALSLISSAIHDFYHDGMYIVSWQNGIDTEQEIARVLGNAPVMRAVVNYGCTLLSACRVHVTFHHKPHYIQELAPESQHSSRRTAETFSKCGLTTHHTDQIVPLVWRKTIMNASMNPVCAVTGLTMAQAMNDPIVFDMVDILLKECIRIARSNEIHVGWDCYKNAISYMKKAGGHKPSMLVDVEAKRRTEIDFINGKFIEYGTYAGIETPYNKIFRGIVKALEAKNTT